MSERSSSIQAFASVIMNQGSPELVEKYGSLVVNRGIIGCYLQTELGHGTNVTQLETTATYLPTTQEFEINSPSLTSTKWWIGGLGKTATHGVLQARLILPGGRDVGPHLFFVQLRSLGVSRFGIIQYIVESRHDTRQRTTIRCLASQ